MVLEGTMKKTDAIEQVINFFFSKTNSNAQSEANIMLNFFLNTLRMKAPTLPPDHCQALYNVYVEPNTNIWEEDFNQDPKAVEALNKILTRKNLPLVNVSTPDTVIPTTPEQEVKINQIVEKFNKGEFVPMKKDLETFLKTNSWGDFIYDAEHKMGLSHSSILRLIGKSSL